jgi:hypothetical protein
MGYEARREVERDGRDGDVQLAALRQAQGSKLPADKTG